MSRCGSSASPRVPAIRKEDLFYLRINAVEQAQDETKQAILKQEDARLMVILQAAVTDYATRPDHTVTPNHNVTEASGYFTPQALYIGGGHDRHARDCSRRASWSTRSTGGTSSAGTSTRPAGPSRTGWSPARPSPPSVSSRSSGRSSFRRARCSSCRSPNFLGVFPVLYSLDVEENHRVEAFWKGWVFDEMVTMAILNPRGIATITKS